MSSSIVTAWVLSALELNRTTLIYISSILDLEAMSKSSYLFVNSILNFRVSQQSYNHTTFQPLPCFRKFKTVLIEVFNRHGFYNV